MSPIEISSSRLDCPGGRSRHRDATHYLLIIELTQYVLFVRVAGRSPRGFSSCANSSNLNLTFQSRLLFLPLLQPRQFDLGFSFFWRFLYFFLSFSSSLRSADRESSVSTGSGAFQFLSSLLSVQRCGRNALGYLALTEALAPVYINEHREYHSQRGEKSEDPYRAGSSSSNSNGRKSIPSIGVTACVGGGWTNWNKTVTLSTIILPLSDSPKGYRQASPCLLNAG